MACIPSCFLWHTSFGWISEETIDSGHDLRRPLAHKFPKTMLCVSFAFGIVLQNSSSSSFFVNPTVQQEHIHWYVGNKNSKLKMKLLFSSATNRSRKANYSHQEAGLSTLHFGVSWWKLNNMVSNHHDVTTSKSHFFQNLKTLVTGPSYSIQ